MLPFFPHDVDAIHREELQQAAEEIRTARRLGARYTARRRAGLMLISLGEWVAGQTLRPAEEWLELAALDAAHARAHSSGPDC